MRKQWTTEEDAILVEHYPHTSSAEIADLFGCPIRVVYKRAFNLGIKKSRDYAETKGGWLKVGNKLAVGNTSNTGRKFVNRAPRSDLLPTGTERVNRRGETRVKMPDGHPGFRWQPKNRVVWEANHGPIPESHLVVFKDGDKANFEDSNLVLVSKAEFVLTQGIHNYPEDLKKVVWLTSKITRAIKKRIENE